MTVTPIDHAPASTGPSRSLILALAVAAGVTVANIYYSQPLVGAIGESFGLDLGAAGLLVTIVQLGYVAGLIFVVPLGDLIENRTLILVTLGALTISLLLAAVSPFAWVFVAASIMLGLTATATQLIVPLAAHLAPLEQRGRIVGTVMSGLLVGILLARPLGTLLAGIVGWRGVFVLSAVATAALMVLMLVALPRRHPGVALSYPGLLRSLATLLATTPVLQQRSALHACLFAAFSLFWTASPLVLQLPPFSLGHLALSAFLLSGAAGAFTAPVFGHLADKGHDRILVSCAIASVAACFVLTWFGGTYLSIAAFVIAGILLDAGVQANMIASQRAIYALPADIRSRLNAIYLAIFFFGGAIGSAVSGFALTHGGMTSVSIAGLALAACALAIFIRGRRRGIQ